VAGENFLENSNFFKKIPADSNFLTGNLPIAHHICISVAH
jgi:hypothetical protein